MTALVSMLALAAVCWLFRIAFVTLLPAERLPAQLRSSLEYLAPAVLAAIIAVELVGLIRDTSADNALPLAAAVIVLALVARLTRSLTLVSATALLLVLALDVAR